MDNKREKIQIANIRNEKVSITTDHADIKRVMRDQEQFYIHKFDILDEMDQFLENHKTTTLTQYEIDNLNSPISIREMEFIVEELPKKKSPRPKVKIRISILQSFPESRREHFPGHFMKLELSLYQNQTKIV